MFEKYVAMAKRAVFAGSKEVMKIYSGEIKHELKNDGSVVTKADLNSHLAIKDVLTDFPILSEEGDKTGRKNDTMWIVDPLDGTNDFLNKTGDFSIMVGLLRKGKPLLGVVYIPAKEDLYFASYGKGAYKNGKRIHVRRKGDVMLISRNHTTPKEKEYGKKLGANKFTPLGSIGTKLCTIAEGKADFYVNLSNKLGVWDACAPHMIVEEAGGIVTDKDGDALVYTGERMKKGLVAKAR